ncbi:adenine specific DNA methyltransferase [hydrothermal vent metagenome]|uniref:Adenine specific DNA methyltransferase n=1 Tax=hydrothermal vent metagenome TaxID=652676 RepID=A0A3B0R0F2_9ZZZZ
MEDAAIGETPYPFDGEAPEDGELDCVVDKPRFEPQPFVSSEVERQDDDESHVSTALDTNGRSGRVYINGKGEAGQYFSDVPELAWNFYIGGYQPAQKWLKDRKGRKLSWDDIRHYQKIIKILSQTDRIMKEIKLPLAE